MFNSFVDRAGEELIAIIEYALDERVRLKNKYICTEHLLLGIALDEESLASCALGTLQIDYDTLQREVDKQLLEKAEIESPFGDLPDPSENALTWPFVDTNEVAAGPMFSQKAIDAMLRAEEYSRYFGTDEVRAEHLLLGVIELEDSGAQHIFEELSANLTFLKRQIMRLIAQEASAANDYPATRPALINGLKELVDKYENAASSFARLAERSRYAMPHLPGRNEIVHMVCVGFMPDFLFTQVAFQRYLLEETISLLVKRTGSLDKEVTASIVSTGAQNFRAEVRSTIEHLLSHEYRLLNDMLDEAEHDLIGSVIEDLWWAQSEEIALQELYAQALEDHRRKHLLSMQRRILEVSQRLTRLKSRLEETIRQCFVKRSASA